MRRSFALRYFPSHSICAFVAVILTLLGTTLTAAAATETVLHSFSAWPNGYQPSGGLIADSAGNFYGLTGSGGKYGEGAVYELTPNSQGGFTETVIYSFAVISGGSNGKNPSLGTVTGPSSPVGTLVFDSAGNLYDATNGGGPAEAGVIFELTPHSNGKWTERNIYSFHFTDGGNPNGGLVFGQDGNLYGTTYYGGGVGRRTCINGGCGTVFRLTPAASGPWTLTTLYRFQGGSDGSLPNANLVFDAAGHIFGSTRFGGNVGTGSEGEGVIFELSQGGTGWVESVIYTFTDAPDGGYPNDIISDSKGNLYGSTSSGGTGTSCFDYLGSCGMAFELVRQANGPWKEEVLHSFNNTDGAYPYSSLTFDASGNLYGTTLDGGSYAGTVFQLSKGAANNWTESTVWNFTGGTDGFNPYTGVLIGSAGQIYGTTSLGGGTAGNGTAFELNADPHGQWKEKTMCNFADGSGDSPTTNLIFDAAGNLYGTASRGGKYGFGAVYELVASGQGTWTEKILYNFPAGDVYQGQGFGAGPSSLVFDTAGNLYGETQYGGSAGFGSIFELSPSSSGWTEKDVYIFSGGADGTYPQGGLVFDAAGNLYGTTEKGGTGCKQSGCGTVFELQGAVNKIILYHFAGGTTDGQNPVTSLTFDQAGNLYGTTLGGGVNGGNNCGIGCGSVFELSPASGSGWKESGIYFFTEKHGDGAIPNAGLVIDGAGNLYGTTSTGGLQDEACGIGCGTAFKISPVNGGGLTESVIYSFTTPAPIAGLVFDSQGNLYGTTNSYSSTVFELSPQSNGGWNETTLYTFSYGNGQYPQSSLILDAAGNLYGTTAEGGSAGGGTVFEITP